MKKIITLTITFTCLFVFVLCSSNRKSGSTEKPVNIILMIGDGMGVSQVYAGMMANHDNLNMVDMPWVGLMKTNSANRLITDSGAAGTAIATGFKTFNGAISVGMDSLPRKTVLEYAEDNGIATGLISTSAITHATPASFISHQVSRNSYEAIAEDFLKTEVDVIIGGGIDHFKNRTDGKVLTDILTEKKYRVFYNIDSVPSSIKENFYVLTAPVHNPRVPERGDMLLKATDLALQSLDRRDAGFFLMIEGSQIDWGGHENNTEYIVNEMLDFDKAVGKVLEYAKAKGNTLVIVTADHECGGMAITGGNIEEGRVEAGYCSKNHTPVLVPVFAYGPDSKNYSGVFDNTGLFQKLINSLDIPDERDIITLEN